MQANALRFLVCKLAFFSDGMKMPPLYLCGKNAHHILFRKHFVVCLKATVQMLKLLDIWCLLSLCFPDIVVS